MSRGAIWLISCPMSLNSIHGSQMPSFPAVGWVTTIAEIALGVLLLIGLQTRWVARFSGCLLLAFALSMAATTGVKTALDYSVFAASGGAFLLASARNFPWSVDEARKPAA